MEAHDVGSTHCGDDSLALVKMDDLATQTRENRIKIRKRKRKQENELTNATKMGIARRKIIFIIINIAYKSAEKIVERNTS